MIQTVIFDLDGTILNTLEDLTNAGNYVCTQNNWPCHSQEEFRAMIGGGLNHLIKQMAPATVRSPLLMVTAAQNFCAYYDAHDMDCTKPYDGIMDMLTALKAAGIQLGVYSNKNHEFTQVLAQHYFPGLFQVVQGKCADVPAKPHTTGTFQVLEALGADAETTLFVGDSPVDVETAHNAALTACAVTWGFRDAAELALAKPQHMAHTPADITALVLGA